MGRNPRLIQTLVIAVAVIGLHANAEGRQAQDQTKIDNTIEAGEADDEVPVRRLVKWNEYQGQFFTFRMGGGLLLDYAGYAQDAASQEQFDLTPEFKVRDGRLLFKGRLNFKRQVSWTCGVMYDGPSDKWLVRETGLMIEVPELSGHIFVGRTKEGFSLNKVMVGYAGWTMERATITDATIPILADGIKWLGYVPKARLLWNVGAYGDALSKGQSFSSYHHQYVARVAWVPMQSADGGKLLHLGVNARYGDPKDGELRLRSRPEAFPAPYFVDTGFFPAKSTTTMSAEAYYRPGPLILGTEYVVQKDHAPTVGNPTLHGGDVAVSWLATGETRVYNTRGGFFNQVSPKRTVFDGGPGAWELVFRASYIDLDSQSLAGGRFWRVTPMVNWHLSDQLRLEFAYGVGSLNRFGLIGHTQFFQARLQVQL